MLSLGYVTARIVECVFIAAGILCVLGIVSLAQDDPGAGSLAVSLAAIKDWTFLLGPGVVVGIGNGLILGYLMYRSELVPRPMAMLGIVGGPAAARRGDGRAVRRHRAGRDGAEPRDGPRVRVGAVARRST